MSFELNKIAGAFLGALLLAMSLALLSDGIFAHHKPAKPGYDLPAAEPVAAAAVAPPAAPLPERLAKADPAKGEAGTKACQSCHSFEKGAAAKSGPPLYGVVARPLASVAGFAYSDSLKTKGGDWTPEELDLFLANPKAFASGTKMTYAGERDPGKRADLIAYLETLSDQPKSPAQSAPDAPKPDIAKPDAAKSEAPKSEAPKPEAALPESGAPPATPAHPAEPAHPAASAHPTHSTHPAGATK